MCQLFSLNMCSSDSDSDLSDTESTDSLPENNCIHTHIKLCGKSKPVTSIYHISDIKIWNNQRHDEYKQVFDRLYTEIKADPQTKLIVITGTLIQNRTDITPGLIAQRFLNRLTKLSNIILATSDSGNTIASIVSDNSSIHYLRETGVYQYRNIAFGFSKDSSLRASNIKGSPSAKAFVESVDGTLALSLTPGRYDYKIAISNCEIDENAYDYCLIGGRKQGSLIQQSDETEYGTHGYDLIRLGSKIKHIPILNHYGICKITIKDDVMIETKIPKKPTIYFSLDNTSHQRYQEIYDLLHSRYQIQSSTVSSILPDLPSHVDLDRSTVMKQFFESKSIDEQTIDQLLSLHNKIVAKTSITKSASRTDWKIVKLSFDNTLSYGKGNVIDFSKYNTNTVIGIVAPNRYGKTAILDIILYCLFEKLSRGDKTDILNKNRKTFSCSLQFILDSNEYLIERSGKVMNGKLVTEVKLFKLGKRKVELSGYSKAQTNKKIVEMIGSYHDYLITCFALNKSDSFIDMSQLQKKEYLYDILRLTSFEQCHNIAKAKLKKYQVLVKALIIHPELLQTSKEKLLQSQLEIRSLQRREYLDHISFDNRTRYRYPNLSSYDLSSLESVRKCIKKEMRVLTESDDRSKLCEIQERYQSKKEQLDLLKQKIKPIREKYQSLSSKLVKIASDYDDDELNDLKRLRLDRDAIRNKITKLEAMIVPVNLENLVSLQKRLGVIDSQIHDSLHNLDRLDSSDAMLLIPERDHNRYVVRQLKRLSADESFVNRCVTHLEDLERKIDNSQESLIDTKSLFSESKRLWKRVLDHNLSQIYDYDNKMIKRRLEELNESLSKCNRLEYLRMYEGSVESNRLVLEQMNDLEIVLEDYRKESIRLKEICERLENRVSDLSEKIGKKEKECVRLKKVRADLELYCLIDIYEGVMTPSRKRWDELKKRQEGDKRENECKIAKLQGEQLVHKREIERYLEVSKEHDRLTDLVNQYQLYVSATHFNGIPYELVKRYLPLIESHINAVLNCISDFTVSFVFEKQNLDMVIVSHNSAPINVQLASGFEKFIIGLSLRIILGKISHHCKPNFIVVDEGWSCMDSDNLSKISQTLTSIKSHYDHIILISHLSELNSQTDYVLTIEKNDGFSRVL